MGKGLNPADSFRKQEKKKDIARNKKQKAAVKEVQVLLNDPSKIEAEITKVAKELEGNKANKTLRDKLAELQRMKEVALMKKSHETMLKKPDEKSVPPAEAPEATTYRHPQYYPPGAAPAGMPMHYRAPTMPLPYMQGPPMQMYPQVPYGYNMPYPTLPMGGTSGIPLPPPPRPGLPMGGSAGVPLPPPRTSAQPTQRSTHPQAQQRQQVGYSTL